MTDRSAAQVQESTTIALRGWRKRSPTKLTNSILVVGIRGGDQVKAPPHTHTHTQFVRFLHVICWFSRICVVSYTLRHYDLCSRDQEVEMWYWIPASYSCLPSCTVVKLQPIFVDTWTYSSLIRTTYYHKNFGKLSKKTMAGEDRYCITAAYHKRAITALSSGGSL